jgi:hypothetical protein
MLYKVKEQNKKTLKIKMRARKFFINILMELASTQGSNYSKTLYFYILTRITRK